MILTYTTQLFFHQLSDELPIVIALIDQQTDSVVAGCKLSRVGSSVVPTGTVLEDVPEDLSTALLLQNVIVQRSLRGAGLGRRLLSQVEAYATRYTNRNQCIYRCAQSFHVAIATDSLI